jgi:hypothetical protein
MIVAAAASTTSTETAPTNMVVNFDSTSFDSSLSPGDSGILNLVIKNSGGRRADNVEVYIPSTAAVSVDKRFYVGSIAAGESKTIPVTVRVSDSAKTGLTAVNVKLTYNGFDSSGNSDNNKVTAWDIPLRVYGKPSFQMTPEKTTYFKDTVDDLKLDGRLVASVKDLEATLTSDCVTVIGSSRQNLGDLSRDQTFELDYQIKPTKTGACTVSLRMEYTDESGASAKDNISLGLNIEDAGVDFKVANVSYKPTGPGEAVTVSVGLTNVGKADAIDTTVALTLDSPFVPVDTSEKYVGAVSGGESVATEFNIAVGWDAETKTYSIPLKITYKVGGTTYNVTKNIGLEVSGKVILEVINVQSSRGSIRVDVANIGTRTADGVKATLIVSAQSRNQSMGRARNQTYGFDRNQTPSEGMRPQNVSVASGEDVQLVSYKSDIKPSKQTTFTFTTQATGPATLMLEYTGLNNERVTQTERIMLSASAVTGGLTTRSNTGTSTTTYLIYGVVILAAAVIVHRFYKRRKKA